jgi:hypothetical protein
MRKSPRTRAHNLGTSNAVTVGASHRAGERIAPALAQGWVCACRDQTRRGGLVRIRPHPVWLSWRAA